VTLIKRNEQTTVEPQHAFVDLFVSSLQVGLTNVATYTLDDPGTRYTRLPNDDEEGHKTLGNW